MSQRMSTETQNWKAINVHLAGRVYPITVLEEQEEIIRAVAKDINERVAQFQLQYGSQKDKQDCLAMAILGWSLEWINQYKRAEIAETPTVSTEQLDALHALLDQALQRP
jgi:cell division protein ZapA (FtsZ GTPase activity inhibitor)